MDSIVCGAPSDARRVELSMRHYILARVSMSCEMLGLHDPMSMSCMIHPVTEQRSTAQTCQRRLRLTILLRQLEPCCLWKGFFSWPSLVGWIGQKPRTSSCCFRTIWCFGLNLRRQTFALSFSYSKFFLGDYDYSSDMC